ncbi:MAG: hypothetical protein IPM29_30605 [Planctomycetes bacterium]|nr:hypothetical protein [Planctomycetota bacterium]
MNLADACAHVLHRQFGAVHGMTVLRASTFVVRRSVVGVNTLDDLDDHHRPHADAHLTPGHGGRGHDHLLTDREGRCYVATNGTAYADRAMHSMWGPDDAARGIAGALNTAAGEHALGLLRANPGRGVFIQSSTGARAVDPARRASDRIGKPGQRDRARTAGNVMTVHAQGAAPTTSAVALVTLGLRCQGDVLYAYTCFPRSAAGLGNLAALFPAHDRADAALFPSEEPDWRLLEL